MIVADASVVVHALTGSQAAIDRLADEWVCAPHLIDAEVVSALRKAVMTKVVASDVAAYALAEYAQADILRYEHLGLLGRVWELRDNVTPYDALYVALAELQEVPLVTTDSRLAQAPGIRATVELIPVAS